MYANLFDLFTKKYSRLDKLLIIDTVEWELRDLLSTFYGHPVHYCLTTKQLYPLSPLPEGIQINFDKKVPDAILVKAIKVIDTYLGVSAEQADYYNFLDRYNVFNQSLLEVKVSSISNNGDLYCTSKYIDDLVMIKCEYQYLSPPERRKYKVGDIMLAFVANVSIKQFDKNTTSICLDLKRNNLKFPELLAKYYLIRDYGDSSTKIKVAKRICGYQTTIISNKFIPKNVIQNLAKELNGERVKVKFIQEDKNV